MRRVAQLLPGCVRPRFGAIITEVIYEWDAAKAAANLRCHRVSFAEATSVFLDPAALTFNDPDHSEEENREITIGISPKQRVLFVSHCARGERIRIISAEGYAPREESICPKD
ncbi:MAG TPA: BrnT family toxin [Terriglobia bacterium]|nr:BrnT family toxin [Terriglobia bacterium]